MFERIKIVLEERSFVTKEKENRTKRMTYVHWRKIMFFNALLISFLITTDTKAQEKDQLLFQRFENHFSLLDSLIFKCNKTTLPIENSSLKTDLHGHTLSEVDSLIDIKVQELQRAMRAETGLLISGQTYYRPSGGFGIDIDEDDVLEAYSAKAQVEVRWNIFSSSLHNRKGRLKELSLQGELEHVLLEQEHANLIVEKQKKYFREEYDSLLSSILQLRINNLQLLNDAQSYLASDRSIGTDELLKIMDEQAIAERLLTTIPKDYPTAAQLSQPEGGIIHLDTAQLKRHIYKNTLLLQVADLQIKLLQQKEENTSYLNTLNLSPFLRYSYYVRPELKRNSSNVDAGIAFQIPLSVQESRKRRALTAERLQKSVEKEELVARLIEQVDEILLEIERANKGLVGELKRIDILREYMQLRRQNYQGHIGEYNFISRIKEYNHYLTCWENYYSYQYKRDCYIADLQMFLNQQSILDFCIIQ